MFGFTEAWDAVTGGGASDLLGEITGSNATRAAIEAQTAAADKSAAITKYMYDTQRADFAPWREAGVNALAGLQDPNFGKNLEFDPGWQARMEQGRKAIEGSMASRGASMSGAASKALVNYGQEFGSNEYEKAYNRQYDRLKTLAGFGSSASANSASAAGNYGNNMADIYTQTGNVIGSANIAQGNRNTQLLTTGAGLIFSDRRLKTDIYPVLKEDMAEMKSILKAFKFNYIQAQHGKGEQFGIMAQDLEKSKIGKTLVVEDKDGNKMIDIGKVMTLWLATLAEG